MAFLQGTAAGHKALLAQIKTMATTHADLVAAGQQWTVLRDDSSATGDNDSHELILKGPGLSGTEDIYIGFKTAQSTLGDYYNLWVGIFTGYVASSLFENQPNGRYVTFPLWQHNIPFWMAINGQRIICMASVETQYDCIYVGKFFPYGSPGQFPYPICICGSVSGLTSTRYSDTARSLGFKGGGAYLALRHIDGNWLQPQTFPWINKAMDGCWGDSDTQFYPTSAEYPLLPIILTTSNGLFGQLDGVWVPPGFALATESKITVAGVPHIVCRDIFRTGMKDYIAIAMQ